MKGYQYIIFLMLIAGNAKATTVLYQNLHQLIDSSDHVVSGVVTDITARKEADGNIYTVVTLDNAQVITTTGLQDIGSPVKIRHLGGSVTEFDRNLMSVERETLQIQGAPEFELSERFIVFIKGNGVNDMPVLGLNQGIFRITNQDEILDFDRMPVVGMVGADLVFRTSKGLMYLGHVVSENYESESHPGQVTFISSDSDYEDVLIEERAVSGKGGRFLPDNFAPYIMDKSNFYWIIQNHLASTGHTRSSLSLDSLKILPPIVNEERRDIGLNSNEVISPAIELRNYPIRAPEVKPDKQLFSEE